MIAMFSCKLWKSGEEMLLAVADSSIVGKRFEENDLVLDIDRDFYGEKACSEGEVMAMIKDAGIINAAGNDIIKLLIKEGVVDSENVIKIGGVPHAQVISIQQGIQ